MDEDKGDEIQNDEEEEEDDVSVISDPPTEPEETSCG
jgi:hypothetical protein